jgi:hypothetical protein
MESEPPDASAESEAGQQLPEPALFDLLELAIDMRLSENDLWVVAEQIAEHELLELEVSERLQPIAKLLRAVYLMGYGDGVEQGFRIHPRGKY